MTDILSLSLDRTSLSLSPLLIYPNRAQGPFWISGAAGDEVDEPDFVYRYNYAPDSAYVAGKVLLAAVLDQATLPAVVRVLGTSATDLATKKAELRAALGQFSYSITLSLNGVASTFSADCSTPAWGAVQRWMQVGFTARAVLTIPVNPPGAP